MQVVSQTQLNEFPLISQGKVRDIYEIDSETLLLVTTDRMSAFDVIMQEPIPYKGVVLNQLSLFWMQRFEHLVPNHILSADVDCYPVALRKYKDILEGRSLLAKKAKPLAMECIVRAYITGSALVEYKAKGTVCDIPLPTGLVASEKLPQLLFTPSTKAALGEHDENISPKQGQALLGKESYDTIEKVSLSIFAEAEEYARSRGIIIADTKFEFGLIDNKLHIIDEVLTPDSSRFWPADAYQKGQEQPSFDKQFLRDWLLKQDWNKKAPAPQLPKEIVEGTSQRYFEAYERITGKKLDIN